MILYSRLLKSIPVILISGLTLSCEDIIDPNLENAEAVVVVDAWINNKSESQIIRLTTTQPYFESRTPVGVPNATVTITDDTGKGYLFNEDFFERGTYVWNPPSNEVLGEVGRQYLLTIQHNGETYQASSYMGRVPVIDSITFTFEEENSFQPDSYIADFWATDPKGKGDAYWIRATKNGEKLNRPREINLAFDAGFSAGGDFDGVTFITPIRRGVNPLDVDDNDQLLSPFQPGDVLAVEIHSITPEAFNFMNEVIIQTDRPGGFAELFAAPISNVSTNIFNVNTDGPKVLGFFNVAAVSSAIQKFEQ
ncbi:MAG: DUF4249 domain-containing protein [Cyclobacteriaceae bacterium]